MVDVTLCFLTRDAGTQVLLGLKKAGFGAGKMVGLGGHLEPGESAEEAIVREVEEESTLVIEPADLSLAGTVDFRFPQSRDGRSGPWTMHSTVFLCDRWRGVPVETDEISPRWYDVGRLPTAQMWQDAGHWLPRFLAGERLVVDVELNADQATVRQATARVLG